MNNLETLEGRIDYYKSQIRMLTEVFRDPYGQVPNLKEHLAALETELDKECKRWC